MGRELAREMNQVHAAVMKLTESVQSATDRAAHVATATEIEGYASSSSQASILAWVSECVEFVEESIWLKVEAQVLEKLGSSTSGYPPPAGIMELRIRNLAGDEIEKLQMPDTASFAAFRELLCASFSCEPWSFSVLMDGCPLENFEDAALLSEEGIVSGTVLTLVKKTVKKTLPVILTASWDCAAKILDGSTGECKQTFSGHTLKVNSAVFSADNSRILTASEDRSAKIWDSCTGVCKQTFTGHRDTVGSAVFSADGSKILTASHDRTAKIWDSSTGECKQTFSGHGHYVSSAVFSADNSRILTASWDCTAKIWRSSTGECKQTFSGHCRCVHSAVFSADGSKILTASGDFTGKIWDSSTGECKQTFSGHLDGVRSAVFSADESKVLTASADMRAKIWDSSTGECKQTFVDYRHEMNSAVFSADESKILTAAVHPFNLAGSVKIWDSSTAECVQTLSGHRVGQPVKSAVFSW